MHAQSVFRSRADLCWIARIMLGSSKRPITGPTSADKVIRTGPAPPARRPDASDVSCHYAAHYFARHGAFRIVAALAPAQQPFDGCDERSDPDRLS